MDRGDAAARQCSPGGAGSKYCQGCRGASTKRRVTDGPYNPLEKRNLAESVQRRILQTDALSLGDRQARLATGGAGVYVIYYDGPFNLYSPIAEANRNGLWGAPIYVGKAIPEGQRVGSGIDSALTATRALNDRLLRHANSIEQVEKFEIADFRFRHLVVDDVFITLGEAILIETFQPLWNVALSGFGNNPTGGPRAGQATSLWDTLHPGRRGAGRSAGSVVKEVEELVNRYLREIPSRRS